MRNQREDMLMSMLIALLMDMLIDMLMAMLIDTLKCDFLLFLFHDELHVFGVRTVRH